MRGAMHDLKWVVANLDEARTRLSSRGAQAAEALAPIERLAQERRQLIQSSETERAEQRKASEQMRTLKGDEQAKLRARLKALSDGVKEQEARLKEVEEHIESALLTVPNLPHESVPGHLRARQPGGADLGREAGARVGAKEHTEIGEKLGLLDFARAAKVSGARFVFYRGALARLELGLVQFFLDSARERGYLELLAAVPGQRRLDARHGPAPQVRGGPLQDRRGQATYLIPTAGSAGDQLPPRRDSRWAPASAALPRLHPLLSQRSGQLRQRHARAHPAAPVPQGGAGALRRGRRTRRRRWSSWFRDAQARSQRLGLHYRVVLLCTGDMGFSSEKTYDLEVWLPGQNAYREISSCSSFGEFQARRAQIRFRPAPGEKPRFAATLNGSGLAVGRTLVAILENGQQPDGSVVLPEAIRPYMGGMERLPAMILSRSSW